MLFISPSLSLNKFLSQLLYHEDDPLLFNSAFFFIFFTVVLIAHGITSRWTTLRIYILTLFSIYFFYKTCNWYITFILIAASIDYIAALVIDSTNDKFVKKSFLMLSVVVNIGLLFYFKYTNFFLSIFSSITGVNDLAPLNLILPVGISFYTFENLSYTVDVYQGKVKPVRKWVEYFFFLSFFPKLMMGPIVRAASFIPQIRAKALVSKVMVGEGLYLITSGIVKKMIISDYINANFVTRIFDAPSLHTGVECLFALYGYALVIYCDFSGYSDMAIGMAKWLGFDIGVNFKSPYSSHTISQFWRRWHISLSNWLRDYVYIPLGGNRRGEVKTYRNLIFTMLVGGFWHGASWNFIFWGGLHGLAMALERLRNKWGRDTLIKLPYSKSATNGLAAFITFQFVCFTWIFFRCASFKDSWEMLQSIFANFQAHLFINLLFGYKEVFGIMFIGYCLHLVPFSVERKYKKFLRYLPAPLQVLYLFVIILVAIHFKQADSIPPIYLQF